MRRAAAPGRGASPPSGGPPAGAPSAVPAARLWLAATGLAGAALAVFWGLRASGFVNYDDPQYVTENARVLGGLSWEGVRWAFATTSFSNWHPLTWLSHMADVELFGLDAGAHHVVNVALHGANAALLMVALARMTGSLGRSALAAALFAVHPLHVETVAWVSERKGLLSALFGLLALLAWGEFVRSRRRRPYALAVALFAASLMAKPMLVTLPFVLLLLDVWPLGRLAGPREGRGAAARSLLLEKAPLFALSAASCAVTLYAQGGSGAIRPLETLGVGERLANAVWAYGAYLGQTVWPSGLAVFYPLPRGGHGAWPVLAAVGLVAALTVAAVWARPRAPFLTVGWLWYLGTLVPVIGLVQVGGQAKADRYTYLPLVGLFVAAAWAAAVLCDRLAVPRAARFAAAAAVLVPLALAARTQAGVWRDGVSLFDHALAVTGENAVAQNNLGVALQASGREAEAADRFAEAVRIAPGYADARVNWGLALERAGRPAEAADQFRQASEGQPGSAVALARWGGALAAAGRFSEALEPCRAALALEPRSAEAHFGLGVALAGLGRGAEAAEALRQAVRLDPDSAEAHRQLGRVLAEEGRTDEALEELGRALALRPGLAEAHNDRGIALARAGRGGEAEREFEEALRCRPGYAEACDNLGLLLAARGRLPEAAARFREAIAAAPASATFHNNLGVVLARQGQRAAAREAFREALRLNPALDRARANLRSLEEGGPEGRAGAGGASGP